MLYVIGDQKNELQQEVALALYNQANRVVNTFTQSSKVPLGWELIDGQWVYRMKANVTITVSAWRIEGRAEMTFCVKSQDYGLATLYVCRLGKTSVESQIVDCLIGTPLICSWTEVSAIAPFLEEKLSSAA